MQFSDNIKYEQLKHKLRQAEPILNHSSDELKYLQKPIGLAIYNNAINAPKKKEKHRRAPRISHSGQGATQTSQINVVDVQSGNTDSERTATHPLSYRRRSKLDHHILKPQADIQARTKSNRVSKSRPAATDGNRHWRFRKMTRCAHRSLREDFVQWKAHVDERSGMVRVFCAGRKKSHRGPMSVTSMCVERGLGR